MKKGIVSIFVMMLLIATTALPVVNSLKATTISNLGEVLDQYSDWSDDCKYVSDFEWQEFIPTMVKHTRIEVKIVQWFSGSPNLKLTLEKPLGTVLTSKEMPASAIPSGTCDWVSFDIPDVNLVPGNNYFIKLTAPLGSEYGWGFSANGLYPNGTSSIWPADWCFRTFCLENNPPNSPTCAYDKTNDELVATATDPDGDKIKYGVDWNNDGTVDQWTGFVSSGTQQIIDCNGRKGTVRVIVEDEYGLQSNWVSVTSKSKSILNINQGEFTAEIGIGDEEEPRIYLDGNYRLRGRFTVVYGTTTNGEQEVRFQGLFRGNHFILQIPLRGKIVNIIGRCTIDENREFLGRWNLRGTGINGWIKGIIS
jgi:hypothetical protein